MKPNFNMNMQELKAFLEKNGIVVDKKYKHSQYKFTSFNLKYEAKDKLDRLAKKYGTSRSGFVRLMIQNAIE